MKRRAHAYAYYAEQFGDLRPRPAACEDCGAVGKVQKHHDDYNKPLQVNWLCCGCDAKRHAKQKQAFIEAAYDELRDVTMRHLLGENGFTMED